MFDGEIRYKDGSKYKGKVKNTKYKHGYGTMYNKDGSVQFQGKAFFFAGGGRNDFGLSRLVRKRGGI